MKAASLLYCYDWGEDGFDLYGSWTTGSTYQTLEFGIYPCASQIIAIDGTVHGGGDECNWDFDEHRDYFVVATNKRSIVFYKIEKVTSAIYFIFR